MPQIYDMGPTALHPLRRKACWRFFRPKNPMASARFEPADLGSEGQHATPRPPKPVIYTYDSKTNTYILDAIHSLHIHVWYQIVCCHEELNDRFTYFHDSLLEPFLLFAHVDNCVFYVCDVRMKLTAVKIFNKSQPVGWIISLEADQSVVPC